MPLTAQDPDSPDLLFKGVPRFEPHQTASGQSVLGAEVFVRKEHCNVTVILACDATLEVNQHGFCGGHVRLKAWAALKACLEAIMLNANRPSFNA